LTPTQVDVAIEINDMDGVVAVTVTDNGLGMSTSDAVMGFGNVGNRRTLWQDINPAPPKDVHNNGFAGHGLTTR
jgi:hypothetical protein